MVIAIMGRKNGQLQMLVVDLGELIPKNHLLRKIFAQFIVPYHKIPLFVGFRQLIAEFLFMSIISFRFVVCAFFGSLKNMALGLNRSRRALCRVSCKNIENFR